MAAMEELLVVSGRGACRVAVGTGLLGRPGTVREAAAGSRILTVSDTTVAPLHARAAAQALGVGPVLALPAGERHKTWEQVARILREALARGLARDGVFVGIGGGVVTDMTGFAASIFMRGIPWIAVPTTVLAMVDAAIGGKTGINLPEGKNLAGTFWSPRMVVADVATLVTLPGREVRAGLAEVVKAAWIGDRELLERLDPPPPVDAGERWTEIVIRAIRVKAGIVERDEREGGLRKVLNLGHTVGHALEAATGYRRFLHGEAVAWGMLAAARIAAGRGLLSANGIEALERAVEGLAPLPPVDDLGLDALLPFIGRDKKRGPDGVGWVLPVDDGVVRDQVVGENELARAWEAVRRECGRMVGR